jgi:hypothetical protein
MKKAIIITTILILLISVNCYALRDPLRPSGTTGQIQSLDHVIEKLLSWLWPLSAVIAILMILVGAYLMVVGGASPQQVSLGRKTVLFALIGFAIVTISKGIVSIVTTTVSQTPFLELLPTIITWVFGFLLATGVLMLIVAAYLFATAGGNPTQVGQARKILTYTLIGLAVALTTRGLLYIVISILGF